MRGRRNGRGRRNRSKRRNGKSRRIYHNIWLHFPQNINDIDRYGSEIFCFRIKLLSLYIDYRDGTQHFGTVYDRGLLFPYLGGKTFLSTKTLFMTNSNLKAL